MEFQSQPFIPVAFGGDINTSSVARAFYEAYKVKTKVYGKFPTGPSYNSKITDYTDNRKMDQPEVMLPILKDRHKYHEDQGYRCQRLSVRWELQS